MRSIMTMKLSAALLALLFVSIALQSASIKDAARKLLDKPANHQQVASGAITDYKEYIPASTEQYVLDHADELGYSSEDDPDGCTIWWEPTATNEDIHRELMSYLSDLQNYTEALRKFQPIIPDVMDEIIKGNYNVCSSLKLHPDGVSGLFPSNQLSLSSSGYVEPILPPMRSIGLCTDNDYMGLDFIVHDFETMCRKLKPISRRVLIDMGASLDFHGSDQPIMILLDEYKTFGFHFDHIYAFEAYFTEPSDVYDNLIPVEYMASYHWINAPVTHEEGAKLNPLYSILQNFNEDDFIVVKLDIDTAEVEVPLAHQLLEGGIDGIYHRLVDQFYFEHHVHLGNIEFAWGDSMTGSIKDSLQLFHDLRVKGIPSHFWP